MLLIYDQGLFRGSFLPVRSSSRFLLSRWKRDRGFCNGHGNGGTGSAGFAAKAEVTDLRERSLTHSKVKLSLQRRGRGVAAG